MNRPFLPSLQQCSGCKRRAVIFYANAYGMTLSEIFGGPQLELATWLSLIAVVVNGLGMRVALLRLPPHTSNELAVNASHVNIANSFVAYLFCFAIATVAGFYAFAAPSLAQPIYALVTLKWLAIFILFYSVIQQRAGYVFLFFAVVLELSVGVMGYFANFKGLFRIASRCTDFDEIATETSSGDNYDRSVAFCSWNSLVCYQARLS